MKFDANGQRITSVHRTHQIHDDVVVDLPSRFDGLSDRSLEIVRDMVKGDDVGKLNELLASLEKCMK